MWWILEQACIWSPGKTLTLPNRKPSQRRGANKRRGNSLCQGIGFIGDSNASRRYTCSSFTRKTLRRSRVLLPLDQWSETTPHQKWQEDRLQHSELCTLRCPWSMNKFFKLIFTYISHISYIFIAGSRSSHGAFQHQQEVRVLVRKYSTRKLVA